MGLFSSSALPFFEIISSGAAFGRVAKTKLDRLQRTQNDSVNELNAQIRILENQSKKIAEARFNSLDIFINKFVKSSMEDHEIADMNELIQNDPLPTQILIHRDDFERYSSDGWELTFVRR